MYSKRVVPIQQDSSLSTAFLSQGAISKVHSSSVISVLLQELQTILHPIPLFFLPQYFYSKTTLRELDRSWVRYRAMDVVRASF